MNKHVHTKPSSAVRFSEGPRNSERVMFRKLYKKTFTCLAFSQMVILDGRGRVYVLMHVLISKSHERHRFMKATSGVFKLPSLASE